MKSLAQQMSVYSAYHRHPVNKVIHFIFVPAIVWTLMVALAFLPVVAISNLEFTVAHLVLALLLAWYLSMDFALGAVAVVFYSVLLVLAVQLAALGAATALTVAAIVHVASWAFQFVGHGVWEKRRPALADNLFQVLVAPIFIIAEIAFGLGLKKDLHDEVQALMVEHLPEAEQARLQAAGA